MYILISKITNHIYSYWEDPAFIGLKITRWSINHNEKVIQRDSSIIEVRDNRIHLNTL